MNTDSIIIQTENLTKKYGTISAVEGVSLKVNKGEIYGFLGLNGAGKTTTIRMLLGMIKPTKGAAYIYGKKVSAGNYKLWKHVGFLVEIPYSYNDMTVYENLEIAGQLRGIRDKKAVEKIIDTLKLSPYANRKAGTLSLGNAQRLGLAKTLIHSPDILILDEPTNGLDPAGIYEIRELLLDFANNKGTTIFISSHILAEISKLAARIAIIHKGQLLREIQAAQLDKTSGKRLVIKTHNIEKAKSVLLNAGFELSITPAGSVEITDEKALQNPEEIARLLVYENAPPYKLNVEKEDLETYFLRTIQGE